MNNVVDGDGPEAQTSEPRPATGRTWWVVAGCVLFAATFVATLIGPAVLVGLAVAALAVAVTARAMPTHSTGARRTAVTLAVVVALNTALVVVGVPGVRGSLWELQRVANKINSCMSDAASIDLWRGGIDTIGTPIYGPNQLTADEQRLIIKNGKLGLCAPAIS